MSPARFTTVLSNISYYSPTAIELFPGLLQQGSRAVGGRKIFDSQLELPGDLKQFCTDFDWQNAVVATITELPGPLFLLFIQEDGVTYQLDRL